MPRAASKSASASLSWPGPFRSTPRPMSPRASSGQDSGRAGEGGRQLLANVQGRVAVRFRVLEPARGKQQNAPVVVAIGQLLAELGAGRRVGRPLLLDVQGRVEVPFRLLEFAEPVTHPANA